MTGNGKQEKHHEKDPTLQMSYLLHATIRKEQIQTRDLYMFWIFLSGFLQGECKGNPESMMKGRYAIAARNR